MISRSRVGPVKLFWNLYRDGANEGGKNFRHLYRDNDIIFVRVIGLFIKVVITHDSPIESTLNLNID